MANWTHMGNALFEKIRSVLANKECIGNFNNVDLVSDIISNLKPDIKQIVADSILTSKYDELIGEIITLSGDLKIDSVTKTYELINIVLNDFPKIINRKIPIVFIQGRVDDSTATHPPIGLAMLCGTLLDRKYQCRLFARLKIPPELVWDFWKYEFQCHILDFQILPNDFNYQLFLKTFAPSYVGFRTVSASINNVIALANHTRDVLGKNVKILFGGIHTTVLPFQIIEIVKNNVDFLFLGEAEESFPHFMLSQVSSSALICDIPGVITNEPTNEMTLKNRSLVMNLDEYPSYVDYLGLINNFNSYQSVTEQNIWGKHFSPNGVALLISARGCKGACTFCSTPSLWRWKKGSIRYEFGISVVAKMLTYYDLGYRVFYFRDDDFLCNRERVISILEKINDSILSGKLAKDFGWCCMARADNVDIDLLTRMRDSGLAGIAFGVESGDPEILKSINKKLSLFDVRKANEMCRMLGINFKNYFMIGFPEETWQSVLKTGVVIIDLFTNLRSFEEPLKINSQNALNNEAYEIILKNVTEQISCFDSKEMNQYINQNMSMKKKCQGAINISYCVPYPGSLMHLKNLNKDIFYHATNWQHGPLHWNNNLSQFESPIRTKNMNQDDLNKARQLLVEIYSGCKNGAPERISRSLNEINKMIREVDEVPISI